MSEDRRKHTRYPLFGIAEVRAKEGKDTPPFTALMQNISESGVGLYAHHPVHKGAAVSVTIKFTSREGKKVSDTLKGTVVSITKQEKYYCMGISLDEEIATEKQPNLYGHFRPTTAEE